MRLASAKTLPVTDATRANAAILAGVWLPIAGLVCLVGIVAVAFVASMLHYTRGNLSPPLDDTLIYFQYAKQIAHGHIFVYQNGDQATSGATSFLYPFVLAVGYLAGFRGDKLVEFGLLLNAGFLVAATLLTFAIARRLANDTAGYVAAALVAINGQIAWTFFSLMEIGLHTMLLLVVFYLYLRAKEQRGYLAPFVVTLVVLAWVRPEQTILAILIGLAWAVDEYFDPLRRVTLRSLAPAAAALLATLAYFSIMQALTGAWRTNTYTVQSVLADPNLSRLAAVARISNTFTEHIRFAFTTLGPPYVATAVALLFLFASASLVADDWAERRLTMRTILPVFTVAGIATASLEKFAQFQMHRWQAPYEPLIILISVYGLWTLPRYLPAVAPLVWPAAGILLVTTSIASAATVSEYGENSADIYFQQTAAAIWLRNSTPADTTVALNDAGAMPYYGRRRIYDLIGLVSRGSGEHFREGSASVFERLERLPADQRPNLFIIYPRGFEFANPTYGFLKQVNSFSLARSTIAADPAAIVYTPDYTIFSSGDDPHDLPAEVASATVVDALDVADLEDERAHGYAWRQREVGVTLDQAMATLPEGGVAKVIDGGRRISGRENFTLNLRDPSKPWSVVMRTDAPAGTLDVKANGHAGQIVLPPSEQQWRDVVIARGDPSRDGQVHVDLTPALGTGEYSAFHYWLVQ